MRRPTRPTAHLFFCLAFALALVLVACGSDTSADGDVSGSDALGGDGTASTTCGALTCCDFGYVETNAAGLDFGEACTEDVECRFGTCLQPGAEGNLTNDVFGFCTRGCDCENAEAARLVGSERDELSCLYPPGSQGRTHHVVMQCSSVSDCAAVDPRWNVCQTPSAGGARPVCQARN